VTHRPAALQAFIDALAGALLVGRPNFTGREIVERAIAALDASVGVANATRAPDLAVLSHLEAALSRARSTSSDLGRVADALTQLLSNLPWRQRTIDTADEGFASGHANVTIIGPGGMEDRHGFWIGASLVAPGIRYPDHSHPPEEVYLLMTPAAFRHGGDGWSELRPGETFHNLPGIVHAMRADAEPLLAIWFLWPHDG